MKGKTAFIIILFTLLLFASTIESRHEPEDYRSSVMKGEPLPNEATKNMLFHSANSKPLLLEKNKDCHETLKPEEEKPFLNDVEPRPNITFYPNDVESKESFAKDTYWGKVDEQNEKPFAENFEPRPNLSVYNN